MSSLFGRLERTLLRVIGPADHTPQPPQTLITQREAGEHLPGGWVRRGTPGRYYVVREQAVAEETAQNH